MVVLTEPQQRDDGKWVIRCRCSGPLGRTCGMEFDLVSDEDPAPVIPGSDPPKRRKAGVNLAGAAICPSCEQAMDDEQERDARESAVRERVRESHLPADLRGFTFEEMIAKGKRGEVIEAARTWASGKGTRGLLLHGRAGAGKTRLAATAAWDRLQARPIRYVSVAILIAQISASFSDKGRAEAVGVLVGKGPLVLDDLDKVAPTEWIRGQLFTAIDARVQAGSALLVTTNLEPVKLRERYGEAITSRLLGYCDVHELVGPDYRLELGEDPDARL